MSSGVYLSVVLPAYNEAGSIRSTLSAMRSYLDRQRYTYEIVVSADGDDDTPAIVNEMAREWPALKLTAETGRHGKGTGCVVGCAWSPAPSLDSSTPTTRRRSTSLTDFCRGSTQATTSWP